MPAPYKKLVTSEEDEEATEKDGDDDKDNHHQDADEVKDKEDEDEVNTGANSRGQRPLQTRAHTRRSGRSDADAWWEGGVRLCCYCCCLALCN